MASRLIEELALPVYESLEYEPEVYYGVDIALSSTGELFLQCDKYRDYFRLESLPSGKIEVIQYGHDQGTASLVGSIAPNRFMIFQNNKTWLTVKSTFSMSNATGPLCAYSSFSYHEQEYLWRVRYDMIDHREHLRHCSLLKNEKLVASFVPGPIHFGSGVKLLGNLFLKCYPAQWPVTDLSYHKEKTFAFIGYHEKDPEADLMLVSFVAVWLRVLKESLTRAPKMIL